MKKSISLTILSIMLIMISIGVYIYREAQISVDNYIADSEPGTSNNKIIEALRPTQAITKNTELSDEMYIQQYRDFIHNLPAYLEGTIPPAKFNVDAEGNLIVETSIKSIFDYFLLTIGDIPFEQIHQIIGGHIKSTLPMPASEQAFQLLNDYFSYIDEYQAWLDAFDKNDTVNQQTDGMSLALEELKQLRMSSFSEPVYNAFFSEIEQMNAAYLTAQHALKHETLSPGERQMVLETYQQQLPTAVREAQQQAMTQVHLSEKTNALISEGASQEAVHAIREKLVGQAAAERLAKVDAQKESWKEKRRQYLALMENTPGIDGLSSQEKSQYLADIGQETLGLTDAEIKRMQALDRIGRAD